MNEGKRSQSPEGVLQTMLAKSSTQLHSIGVSRANYEGWEGTRSARRGQGAGRRGTGTREQLGGKFVLAWAYMGYVKYIGVWGWLAVSTEARRNISAWRAKLGAACSAKKLANSRRCEMSPNCVNEDDERRFYWRVTVRSSDSP